MKMGIELFELNEVGE